MTKKLKGQRYKNGEIAKFVDVDAPKSGKLGADKVLRFRNNIGVVVFSVDLSDIRATFGNIVLSTSELSVDEGESAKFTVVLSEKPTKEQTVYVGTTDTAKVDIVPSVMSFSVDNWNVPQTVTVYAKLVEESGDSTVTISLTSRRVESQSVIANIVDAVPPLTQNGLALHYDYMGQSDSATITDLVNGVVATGFDALVKNRNGVRGGGTTKWLELVKNSTEYGLFKSSMATAAQNGFSFESFGSFFGRLFYFEKAYGIADFSSLQFRPSYCGGVKHTNSSTPPEARIPYIDQNNQKKIMSVGTAGNFTTFADADLYMHSTIVCNADGSVKSYLNQNLYKSTPAPEDFSAWDVETITNGLCMFSTVSSRFGTLADDFLSAQRIYNRPLSEQEIENNRKYMKARLGLTSISVASGITLEIGDEYQPEIVRSPNVTLDSVVFESENQNIVFASGSSLKAVSVGTTAVKATVQYHGSDYQASTDVSVDNISYDITQTRAVTGIEIARFPQSIEVGEEYAVQAYLTSPITSEHPYPYGYPDENLVVWESSNPSVCRVKNGVLFGESVGNATITASDLNRTVSESFLVSVTAKSELVYTDSDVLVIDETDYDWTSAESTTLAIQSILASASSGGKKKVVFPNRQYSVSPDYGKFLVPSRMIVDFSGSTIQVVENSKTASGYNLFVFQNTEYSTLCNATILGERDLSGNGAASTIVRFVGANYRSGIENCTLGKAPWGLVGTGFKLVSAQSPNPGNDNILRLAYVEAGGIDDSGVDKEEDFAFRSKGYLNIRTVTDKFGFGSTDGYQQYYISARMYDIFFYDTNKSFISSLKNCVQYYLYDKPVGAMYARVVFRQASAPTTGFEGARLASVFSVEQPINCFVRNCHFFEANDCAISPQGGEGFVIENCTFDNNGFSDPAAHIDWEDGRHFIKGHVLKDCSFTRGGKVRVAGAADSLVIHGNSFGVELTVGSEAKNSRIWLNNFIGAKATISTKTDMVFSQNFGCNGATKTTTNPTDGSAYAIRQANNVF